MRLKNKRPFKCTGASVIPRLSVKQPRRMAMQYAAKVTPTANLRKLIRFSLFVSDTFENNTNFLKSTFEKFQTICYGSGP